MNANTQPPNGDPGDRNEPSDFAPNASGSIEGENDLEQQLPPSRNSSAESVARFLEDIYGALFTPAQTFASLRSRPSLIGGLCAFAIPNILECIRTGKPLLQIPLAIIGALVGWVVFALLLQRLATVFQRSVDLQVLLTLTAFSSLPWIFIGPALSLGGDLGTAIALLVILWFTVWQVWAASVAMEINAWHLLFLVPLAIAGGVVAITWTSNSIGLLLSISG